METVKKFFRFVMWKSLYIFSYVPLAIFLPLAVICVKFTFALDMHVEESRKNWRNSSKGT